MTSLLLPVSLLASVASAALVGAPPAVGASPAFRLARCVDPRIVRAPTMMGRRKKVEVEEEQEETDYAALEAQATSDRSKVKLVDPMTTSLGREQELEPFPGPPVIDGPVQPPDTRQLYACLAMFPPNMMPGDPLQEQYSAWLSEEPAEGAASLCGAHSLGNEIDFDELMASTEVLTDDDLAQLEVEEAAAAAAEEEQAGMEGGEVAPVLEMETFPASFILGHLTVFRADSWVQARAWAAADPIAAIDGYSEACLLQWVRSEDEALNIAPTGQFQRTFVVHCRDKPGATALRASTREKHLAWLKESGRIAMGGPLVSEPEVASSAEGDRVGTLLFVNGDGVDEVKEWAASDPYNAAGLFDEVTVAPLSYYAVDPRARM